MVDPTCPRSGLRATLVTLTGCAMAALAFSCDPVSPLPGTTLGTYNVTGTLGANTCGSGIGAPSPWTFTVQMSQDGTTLYWDPSVGSELSSTMTSSTVVDITSTVTSNVDATEAGVEGPCDLTQATAINLTFGASSPPAPPSSFNGSITYTFSTNTTVSTTSDCTDQLSASGGSYDTLPCTATYSIVGTMQ
jgi:hypothetical protein